MNEQIMTYLFSLPYESFLNYLKTFSHQERLALLTNEKFLVKLLLLDSEENIWLFEHITDVYNFLDLLPYLKGKILNLMDNRDDYKAYVYLVPFIRNNKDEFKKIFTNEEFCQFFLKHGGKIYSELNFDSDFVMQIFNYTSAKEIYIDDSLFLGLVNYSLDTPQKQAAILAKIKDNNIIVRLLFLVDSDVGKNYLKSHVVGLSNSEVYGLMKKMQLPPVYYETPDFFRNYILDYDISKMNQKIMELGENNNVTYLINQKDKMLNKILSLYDKKNDALLFELSQDSDFKKMESYQVFLYLWQTHHNNLNSQEFAKKVIGHIVLEKLFQENYRNLLMDIGEMLAYNNQADPSILSEKEVKFYHEVINFNTMSSAQILAFYEQYKDCNVKELFYDNMRKVKNIAYQKLQDACLKIANMASFENKEASVKYDVAIYELKGEDFTALISCQPPQKGEYAHRIRKCYSLINQNNLKVFNEHAIIYGFSYFPIANIIHVLEGDEGSMDTLDKENLEYINRLRIPEEILASGVMNEIQIANNYDAENNRFLRIQPDYIVCFDELKSHTIMRAKEENLPIVLIDRQFYQNKQKDNKNSSLSPLEYYYSPYSNDAFAEYNGKKL